MIIYRGVKFYPADVEEILASYGITQYRIVLDSKVTVEFEGDESLIPKLERDFKEFLGFKPKLVALPFGTLERFDGKAKRLVKS